jgi:DnaJ like chaperone protein
VIWVGPLIGAVMGLALAGLGPLGVIGALVGAWLGRRFDLIVQLSDSLYFVTHRHSNEREGVIQKAFFHAVFLCLGRVAKCDGAVCEDEIRWATDVMERMGLSPEKRQEAVALFEQGKAFDHDILPDLRRLRDAVGRRSQLSQIFMEILVQCALVDGQLNVREWSALQQFAASLGVSGARLERLVRSAQAYQHYAEPGQASRTLEDRLLDAYAILGLTPEATPAEVKRAWRKLMSKHHPDKLAAHGLPDEMMAMAKEKTQAIQAAYEEIQRARQAAGIASP